MPVLEIHFNRGIERLEFGDDAITIGRHPTCTIVLDDDRSSRRHCQVERAADTFWVRDLGSRNGTKLNRQRVNRAPLHDGDEIKVGGVRMRFLASDSSDQTEDAASSDPPGDDIARHALRVAEAVAAARQPQRAPDEESEKRRSADERDAATTPAPDVALTRSRDVAAAQSAHGRASYEHEISDLVRNLPDVSFGPSAISLVDSRGDIMHSGRDERQDDGTTASAEARTSAAGLHVFRIMLLACLRARATDLHIEPKVGHASVRMRVDGYMVSAPDLDTKVFQLIMGLVKVLCQLDSTRRRDVQDGHFSAVVPGRAIDFRVSLTPSMQGQKLVVRILDTAAVPTRLHELGMIGWMHEKLRTVISRDAGMILSAGPTGSGKTTTLYACLREIDVDQRNVVTIEDPIEYSIEGCTQIPVDLRHGHTFGEMLRSVLRQDPDVILVGEVRDSETATTATQAAMTGHLVLSTVHVRDSIGAIFRLLDLGVEPYLVANSVSTIIAQRLIRLLCDSCKRGIRPTPSQNMRMGRFIEGVATIYTPTGCPACLKTGYFGRRAIFELLECTDELRDVILQQPTIQEIRTAVRRGLFNSLQQSGYQLVGQGVTSVEEIERVAGAD